MYFGEIIWNLQKIYITRLNFKTNKIKKEKQKVKTNVYENRNNAEEQIENTREVIKNLYWNVKKFLF